MKSSNKQKKENREKREEEGVETEEEERKEILKRCVGVNAADGVETWLAKTKFTPAGAIANCAAGIYGPALVSGIKSVLE